MFRLIRPMSRPDDPGMGCPLIFATHFLAFLIASCGAFALGNDRLMPGSDGEFTRNTTLQIFHFADLIPGLPMAHFAALGTAFPSNPLLSPSLLALPLFGERAGVPLGYLVSAGLMFLSTYVFGRTIGLSRAVAVVAAWALPLLCLPYHPLLDLYLIFGLNPAGADNLSFSLLGLAALTRGYTGPTPYWAALGLTLVVIWQCLAIPTWIMLLLPTVIVGIGIMASCTHRPDFVRRSIVLLLPSVLFVALGGGAYLLGIFSNTAVAFFPQEMNIDVTHSWRLSTVATAWGEGIYPLGAAWVGLALAGVALALWRGHQPLRAVAASMLVVMVLFGACIAAYMMSRNWVLPYPIYFEILIWPFYALFAAYAIGELTKAGIVAVLQQTPRLVASRAGQIAPLYYTGLWMAAGTLLGFLMANKPIAIAAHRPPSDTAITRELRLESGIAPTFKFKGYVANLAGFKGPDGDPIDWFALHGESNQPLQIFGNTHRVPYLWRFGIPTVEVINQIVEPAFHAVITRLLDRPGDRQLRSVIIVTRVNIPLMQSLGVRYLITDFPLTAPSRLAFQLVTPKLSHFVFELPDPNYGNFSPTEVASARNATELLQRIAEPSFDFRKTVILDEPLNQVLRPAESSKATLVRGGWQIRARSPGVSILLLPLQFSHCLAVHERQGSEGRVIAVQRANLAITALVFEGSVDVTLSLRVSPFWRPLCRLRDAHEMKEFGLADLPRTIAPLRFNSSVSGHNP